ncbi:helix-turn-helix domain-containing protein [Enterobacter hormaechei]|uniref:helix-turn-helix domain-containing protein n=1 Tax=Enterobacter hormaechei TaxID=158836 RepID=UPI00066963B2|nr:helix-turn-helix transcriptional regulator [Enterobacter hormaechei]AVE73349.1 XRE family transcriptional regulator [Enterobacter cloacae complex sp.]MCF0008243.1 helix-turn-helix transcriptional regulator [Enterobacter hormaechei]MDE4075645.1 helix-turn-helix transcriptional regulator [Enterobacter hormaechei subsp. xiangfangensis]MDU3762852.1 helix-turn-helix transcriptional regulator [Enterobacter hormaechei]MDU4357030.1 helix-turn-helix transcriptional regulator [Enterobacter hormaechei
MQKRLRQRDVFIRRLKEARQRLDISQTAVGIAAAVDPSVASTRFNRYEKGVHEPDMETAARIADVLNVPLPWLFTSDENLAELILNFAALSPDSQLHLLEASRQMMSISPEDDA